MLFDYNMPCCCLYIYQLPLTLDPKKTIAIAKIYIILVCLWFENNYERSSFTIICDTEIDELYVYVCEEELLAVHCTALHSYYSFMNDD